MPGGGNKRQKPIREIDCPRCGTRAVFAERKPYCPNCHWNLDKARGALRPSIGGTLWIAIWFAFAIYVVKASWEFLLIVAGLLSYGAFKAIRAWLTLPKVTAETLATQSSIAPVQQPLEFSVARKQGDYSRFALLVPPLFAMIGATMFPWSGLDRGISWRDWHQLWDLGFPFFFMAVGSTMSYRMFRQRYMTRRALSDPVCVWGVVTESSESSLHYRFRDLIGAEYEGEGTEYSGDYYEEMKVPVVYERANPKNNLPVSALYDEYHVTFRIV